MASLESPAKRPLPTSRSIWPNRWRAASLTSQLIRGPLGRTRPINADKPFEDQYDFHFMKGFTHFQQRSFPSIHSSSGFAAASALVAEMQPARSWRGVARGRAGLCDRAHTGIVADVSRTALGERHLCRRVHGNVLWVARRGLLARPRHHAARSPVSGSEQRHADWTDARHAADRLVVDVLAQSRRFAPRQRGDCLFQPGHEPLELRDRHDADRQSEPPAVRGCAECAERDHGKSR